MNIGKFIKTHRKKLNMTQKELAKTLNVSYVTLCRWETNFITPNPQNWLILQNLFGKRKDKLKIPVVTENIVSIKEIKPLEKLQKISKVAEKYKEITQNYKKGISLDNLAKFYSVSEFTIRNILRSQEIQIPRKNTKKLRICKVCNKTFFRKNESSSPYVCSKICSKQYKVEKNKFCKGCGENIENKVAGRKYCSAKCYRKYMKINN
jgi:DNA-binding XRE family transcriptional regulator